MSRLWQRCLDRPALLIAAVASLFAMPLFWYITPSLDSSDLTFYRLALSEFSFQFWHNELYPRWLYRVNDGLGSPVFVFLGPLTYYPSVLLEWMSGWDQDGSKRFILSMIAARVCTGWMAYHWFLMHFSRSEALVMTLLLLLLPYAIHGIYVRTELAEQWCFVFMFMALGATDRLIRSEPSAWLRLAVAYAALILAHLPTFIVFGWVPMLMVLLQCRGRGRLVATAWVFASIMLALGLSAFYWLPLWQNQPFVNAAGYFEKHYFAENFLTTVNELYCVPYFLLAAIAAYSLRTSMSPFWRVQFITLAVVVFMVLPVSLFVWKLVFPLQYLQFPFRFLNAAVVPLSMSAGFLVLHTRLRPWVIMIWLGGILFHSYVIYAFSPHTSQGVIRSIAQHRIILPPEYYTKWQENYELVAKKILANDYRDLPQVTSEVGKNISIFPSAPGAIRATVNMPNSGYITFRRLYFPGMEVRDLRTGKQYEGVLPDNEGLMKLYLPEGEHWLETRLHWLNAEKTSLYISGAAWLLLLLVSRLRRRGASAEA